jgi:hydroxyethylthiazole kinase-like uncharacterized protein yjeF
MPRLVHGPAPIRVDPTRGPWPLHDAAASRAAETAALARHPPFELMARAGLAVARLALAIAPHAGRVQVWAGPGNNGGDGLVAARHLRAAGLDVRVTLTGDAAALPPDAARACREAHQAGVPISAQAPDIEAGLSIDALLGLGARRAPEGAIASAIACMNASAAPVLAVDIPSGLQPDTGTWLGDRVVRATHTLALLTLKPGCFTAQGRDASGRVWFDALDGDAGAPTAWLAGPPGDAPRALASHKGSHGDVVVVGGAAGMVGAAWLAARAALAAGAGRVYASPLDASASLFDPLRPELMGRASAWLWPPEALVPCTLVCGCGGGSAVRDVLPPLLAHAGRLLLDADALNTIASDPMLQDLLYRRGRRDGPTLLTPHPLEAARLLQTTAADVQRDRIGAAKDLAARFGCAVLLKGSGTVVAAPGRTPSINPTGNAALAGPGTGDVLAGWAGGLWAQTPTANAADIAAAAAWQHGRAADLWPAAAHGAPLRASDLVEALARRGFA